MAKIYSFTKFKLYREMLELKEFVENKYKYCLEVPTVWFDHYSIMIAQTRIKEIQHLLRGMDSDSSVSKEEVYKKVDD